MGYCSDVSFVLTGKATEKMKEEISKVKELEIAEKIKEFVYNQISHSADEESGCEMWEWTCIKWNDYFSEVEFINNFLNTLDEDEYYFLRLGENNEDYEIRGDFLDNPFKIDIVEHDGEEGQTYMVIEKGAVNMPEIIKNQRII